MGVVIFLFSTLIGLIFYWILMHYAEWIPAWLSFIIGWAVIFGAMFLLTWTRNTIDREPKRPTDNPKEREGWEDLK